MKTRNRHLTTLVAVAALVVAVAVFAIWRRRSSAFLSNDLVRADPTPPPRLVPTSGSDAVRVSDDRGETTTMVVGPETWLAGVGGSRSPLAAAQQAEFDRALALAEQSSTAILVADLQAAIAKGGGRELHYRALLLRWALDTKGERIEEIHALLAAPSTDDELRRTLLYIVGEVGSHKSRNVLLRCLHEPCCASMIPVVLDALNEAHFGGRDNFAQWYSELSDDPKYVPLFDTSIDPLVVQALLDHTGPGFAQDIRDKAAGILAGMPNSLHRRDLDPQIWSKLDGFFLTLARTNNSARAQNAAASYFNGRPSSEVATYAWDRFNHEDPQSVDRAMAAGLIASQASSVADVLRIVDVARQEPSEMVRTAFILQLHTRVARTAAERSQMAHAIAGWAMVDASEAVRLLSLQTLGVLLPESASELEWARNDASEAVRKRANDLLSQSRH